MALGRLFRQPAKRWRRPLAALLVIVTVCTTSCSPQAADVARVAVASNFTQTAQAIAQQFEQATGHQVVFSFGSTGQLYNQISQGAPFDVFLAADQRRPEMAIDAGFAVPGSRFTYAVGALVLYSRNPDLVDGADALKSSHFTRLAIANPGTAPYGVAAVQVMHALGLYQALRPKIVRGNNIAQTFEFVRSDSAELGFVALSQLAGSEGGSRWVVPQELYQNIAQDAVLLKHGQDNRNALAFIAFLQGPKARAIEKRFGYKHASGAVQ